MGSNYKITYNVDMVFCIDCTGSMDNILNIVKDHALNFYKDVQNRMGEKDKEISKLRIRVIAFRDYVNYKDELASGLEGNEPMLMTDFFVLPEQASDFEISVRSLQPAGGGDDPEDGLEALAYAIRSKWDMQGMKNRHIIVVWTDEEPHELGFGKSFEGYPKGMARDMNELTAWWGDRENPGYMKKQSAKRLILFAPDKGGWNFISDNWDQVIHFPSEAGKGLQEVEYEQILDVISGSI